MPRVHIVDLTIDGIWKRSALILDKNVVYSTGNPEPEDAILGRDMLSAGGILSIVQKFTDASVCGLDFETHDLEDWDEYEEKISELTSQEN